MKTMIAAMAAVLIGGPAWAGIAERVSAGLEGRWARLGTAVPPVELPAVPEPVEVPKQLRPLSCEADHNTFRNGKLELHRRKDQIVATLRGDFGPGPDFLALSRQLGHEHEYFDIEEVWFGADACAPGEWTDGRSLRCQGPVRLHLTGSASGEDPWVDANALLTIGFPWAAEDGWSARLTVFYQGRFFVENVEFPRPGCRLGR